MPAHSACTYLVLFAAILARCTPPGSCDCTSAPTFRYFLSLFLLYSFLYQLLPYPTLYLATFLPRGPTSRKKKSKSRDGADTGDPELEFSYYCTQGDVVTMDTLTLPLRIAMNRNTVRCQKASFFTHWNWFAFCVAGTKLFLQLRLSVAHHVYSASFMIDGM